MARQFPYDQARSFFSNPTDATSPTFYCFLACTSRAKQKIPCKAEGILNRDDHFTVSWERCRIQQELLHYLRTFRRPSQSRFLSGSRSRYR